MADWYSIASTKRPGDTNGITDGAYDLNVVTGMYEHRDPEWK